MTGKTEMPERTPRFGEPFFLQWNVTDRCNLSCAHCYREDPPLPDLGAEGLARVLDRFSAFLTETGRTGRVMLSGGEPLLSPHLFDLLEECRARRLPTRVLSNGTLIDRATAVRLAEAGVRGVQVSVEGGRRTHDGIRGGGTHRAAVSGMRALREAGVQVTLAMTLSADNVADVPSVLRLAEKHADRFHIARHVPIGRGIAGGRPLTPAELHAVLARLRRLEPALARRGVRLAMRDPLWKALGEGTGCAECVSGCSVGYNGVCVDADGSVYPCRRLPLRLGNVLDTPLERLWELPAMRRLRDRDALEGRCRRCAIRWTCGGCRGVAEALLGHPLAEDPQCFRAVPEP